MIKQVFVTKNVVADGCQRNITPPAGIEGKNGKVIREPEAGFFYYNGNFDLVYQRESEFHITSTVQLIRLQRRIVRDSPEELTTILFGILLGIRRDKQARKCSGGIKRRLHVVVSLIVDLKQAEVARQHLDLKVVEYWGEKGVDYWRATEWKKEKYENQTDNAPTTDTLEISTDLTGKVNIATKDISSGSGGKSNETLSALS
ncbi:hypothetical protein Tco_1100636 [Tanacetum coccineum]